MWTRENRPRYNRDKLRYPSDLTDDEWAHVESLIPPAKRGGGKRCPYQKLDSRIAMMEAGKHRLRNEPAKTFSRAASRSVLPDGKVRAGLVVVAGIGRHDPTKMRLAKHDHMVSALASYRADQSLHIGVLLGRMRGDGSIPDAQAAQTSLHDLAVDGVTVSHEILWCFIPRKCLHNLACNPLRGWMRGDGMMNEPPPAVVPTENPIGGGLA